MGHLARLQTLSLLGCLPNSPHGEFAPTSTHPAIKCFKFIFLIPRKKRQHCAQDETKHVYFSFFNPLKVTSLNDSLLFSYAPRYRRVKNTIQHDDKSQDLSLRCSTSSLILIYVKLLKKVASFEINIITLTCTALISSLTVNTSCCFPLYWTGFHAGCYRKG